MGVNVSLSEHREIPNRTLTNIRVAIVVQKTALGRSLSECITSVYIGQRYSPVLGTTRGTPYAVQSYRVSVPLNSLLRTLNTHT